MPALALAAPGDDAELLHDCERAVAVQTETVRLWRARNAAKATLPPQFQDAGIDPREWGEPIKGCEGLNALAKDYLPHYLAAGLGSIHDQMEAIIEELDPLLERLLQAKPRTFAGALALARVWLLGVAENIMVEDDPDDWRRKGVEAGLRALAMAEACAIWEELA
jgi:hypothetical protein